MGCARHVFRCFKWVERLGDRITGAAGPYFVGLAVILISLGTLSFCKYTHTLGALRVPNVFFYLVTVVQPSLPLPWLSTPPCLLIVVNLFVHYYHVCTIPPGFIDDPPRYPGTNFLWASPSIPKSTLGARWSYPGLEILNASVSRCKRCGVMRSEVSYTVHL